MTAYTSQEFFDAKYRQDKDPWRFASSPYEIDRYNATVQALGSRHFRRAIEPGCSIGVLTEKLAFVADEVEASDISPIAVAEARTRCHHLSNVSISVRALSSDLVQGTFDLLVLSEIGYYFTDLEFTPIVDRLVEQLSAGGVLLAVHWLGTSKDHVRSGDDVHDTLSKLRGLKHEHGERHTDFRLDRWLRL